MLSQDCQHLTHPMQNDVNLKFAAHQPIFASDTVCLGVPAGVGVPQVQAKHCAVSDAVALENRIVHRQRPARTSHSWYLSHHIRKRNVVALAVFVVLGF